MFIHHFAIDILIILIYVDDILVTSSSLCQVFSFNSYLTTSFTLQDLGQMNYLLSVEAIHITNTLH